MWGKKLEIYILHFYYEYGRENRIKFYLQII